MTVEQWRLIRRLDRCRFVPGSYDKRFVQDMNRIALGDDWLSIDLTPRQADFLQGLEKRFRKQLAGIADPLPRLQP